MLNNMRQMECLQRFQYIRNAVRDDLCSTTMIGVALIMDVLLMNTNRAYTRPIASFAAVFVKE